MVTSRMRLWKEEGAGVSLFLFIYYFFFLGGGGGGTIFPRSRFIKAVGSVKIRCS